MPEWWFYHLERISLVEALAPLLEKCLERCWRVAVRSPDSARLAELDKALWTYSDASFLPHGLSGGVRDVRQPILLTTGSSMDNSPSVVVLLNGADFNDLPDIERVMVVFEDRDQQARGKARLQFKSAKDSGHTVRYFRQSDGGRWKEQG